MSLHTELKRGTFLTKEAPGDIQAKETGLTALHLELGNIVTALDANRKATETQFTDLTNHYKGVKADSDKLKTAVLKHTADYAALVTRQQTLEQALDQVKKEIDAPIMQGGTALVESDKQAAIELQVDDPDAAMPTVGPALAVAACSLTRELADRPVVPAPAGIWHPAVSMAPART